MFQPRLVTDVIYDPPEPPAHFTNQQQAEFWLDQIEQMANQINGMTLEEFLALGDLEEQRDDG